jgi:hypothetical protein
MPGRVVLLDDDPALLRELRGLERPPAGASGRDRWIIGRAPTMTARRQDSAHAREGRGGAAGTDAAASGGPAGHDGGADDEYTA